MNCADNSVLIVCDERHHPFAELIRNHICEKFPNFDVQISFGLPSEAERLGKDQYTWIITWELIEEKGEGVTFQHGVPNGIEFAQGWLENHGTGRAIVITTSLWKQITNKSKFVDRLSPIPDTVLFPDGLHILTETIHAGQVGYTLIPPTIVELRLYQEENGSCVIELHNDPRGPLQDTVTHYIRLITGMSFDKPKQILGKFDDVVKKFKEARGKWNSEERRQWLIYTARTLYPEPGRQQPNLLDLLLEAVKASLRFWEKTPYLMNPSAPFPVHLHLLCKPDMFNVPIDLIIDEAVTKGHICALLPVTWRIITEGWKQQDNEGYEKSWNLTTYDNFSVVYSCHKESRYEKECALGAIKEAHKKAEKILDVVGIGKCQPVNVRTMEELRKAIIRKVSDGKCHMAHVISHGSRNNPGDLTSIFVGPDDKSNAIPVTANQLSPEYDERGANFAFFNCCELGYQDAKDTAIFSYCGGFAEEVIKDGICYEIIANRWGANQDWAHKLELAFYEIKPCTAQTRAVALLRARLKVLKKMKKQIAEKQYEPTWLAPIHIWAYPK